MKYEYEIGDFENWSDKFDNSRYLFSLFMIFMMRIILALLPFMFFASLKSGAYVAAILNILNIAMFICLLRTKECQKTINFHRRLWKVPNHTKREAKLRYGNQWRPVALECHECHICGDCDVCGAS